MAEKELKHGDRVRLGSVAATVCSVHGKIAISVLPDDRPRSLGLVTWSQENIIRLPRVSLCPRCSERHAIWYCPEGK